MGLGFALLVVLLIGGPLGVLRISNYDETKYKVRAFVVALLAILVFCFEPIKVERIDAGSVGLKIDRAGNNKGIPVAVPVKGWVFYNAWFSDIVEYPIRQNHVAYAAFSVTCKGGFPMDVTPSFNYALKPERVADLYIHLLKGTNFSSLEENYLKTATMLSLNNASNYYPIDSIFNNKAGYNKAVENELNRELSAYFYVTQINPGTVAPPELKQVIIDKTNAVQNAQKAELQKITAIADAQTKMANARGDSAEKVINALADAKVIELKTKELSPTYVEYIKWSNAGDNVPRVPSTILGSGTSYLMKQ